MKCQRCGKDAVAFTSDESTFGWLFALSGENVYWTRDEPVTRGLEGSLDSALVEQLSDARI